jgi:glycosyltransferase involved in cell wall biosynthesis
MRDGNRIFMTKTAAAKHPILIVTENLNVGGAEKYTVLVANELYARGHRVVVFANSGPLRKHFLPGIRFVRAFFEHGILGVLYGAFQMTRISLQERIPLIHAQKLESSQAAWLARFVTHVPVVKTAHGYTPAELARLGRKIDKYSDKVVTVVDWLLPELHKNGVQSDKLRVIYNGMTPIDEPVSLSERKKLRERLGIAMSDKVIVSVARLERGKNYASLIKWFPSVLAEIPEAKLIIVGSGPEKKNLIKEVNNLHLGNAIIFVEGTTNMEKYLHIADVFCTPTIARGMAVLEAMAAGLPVVGTEPNGAPHVVLDGETGFVVKNNEGDAFAKRIVQLLLNPEFAKRFGAAGKARMHEQFSHVSMVDQLEDVYAEFVADAR